MPLAGASDDDGGCGDGIFWIYSQVLQNCTQFFYLPHLSTQNYPLCTVKLALFLSGALTVDDASEAAAHLFVPSLQSACSSSSCFLHGPRPTSNVVSLTLTRTTIMNCTTTHANFASFTISTSFPCLFSSNLDSLSLTVG